MTLLASLALPVLSLIFAVGALVVTRAVRAQVIGCAQSVRRLQQVAANPTRSDAQRIIDEEERYQAAVMPLHPWQMPPPREDYVSG